MKKRRPAWVGAFSWKPYLLSQLEQSPAQPAQWLCPPQLPSRFTSSAMARIQRWGTPSSS